MNNSTTSLERQTPSPFKMLHNANLQGFLAVIGSGVALITSFQEQLEFGLRCGGLVLSIILSLLAIANYIRNFLKKRKDKDA
jgi:hypothetical protein